MTLYEGPTGRKAIENAVDVTVPSEKMDCDNGTMNDHMRKALKVSDFPTIVFRLANYDVAVELPIKVHLENESRF